MRLPYIVVISIMAILLFDCKTPPPSTADSIFDVNPKYDDISKRLFYAVKKNDVNLSRECLEKGADPNVADMLNQTALMWAAWNGNDNIVELLLKRKANVNAKNNSNVTELRDYTALLCAAYNGHDKVYDLLVKSGADQQHIDASGETVLHKAVKSGSYAMISKWFIDYPNEMQKIMDKGNTTGYTALHLALYLNKPEIAKSLLDKGANPAIAANTGKNRIYPLYTAYVRKSYSVFCSILEKMPPSECDVSVYDDKSGKTMRLSEIINLDINKGYVDTGTIAAVTYHPLSKYADSVDRRKKRLPALDKDFENTADRFMAVIQDNKSFEEVKSVIQSNEYSASEICDYFVSQKGISIIEEAILSVNKRGQNETKLLLDYLLRNGVYSVNRGVNVLAFSCIQYVHPLLSPQEKDNFLSVIEYIAANADNYDINLNSQGEFDKKTFLMYMIGNNDFCEDIKWEKLLPILEMGKNKDILISHDSHSNDLRYYALNNKSSFKNEIFDYIYNNVTERRSDRGDFMINDGDQDVMMYALNTAKFYYASNKILRDRDAAGWRPIDKELREYGDIISSLLHDQAVSDQDKIYLKNSFKILLGISNPAAKQAVRNFWDTNPEKIIDVINDEVQNKKQAYDSDIIYFYRLFIQYLSDK